MYYCPNAVCPNPESQWLSIKSKECGSTKVKARFVMSRDLHELFEQEDAEQKECDHVAEGLVQIEFSLAKCCPTRRMTFGHLQWPLEYLTRVQTLNYHLESKAISISIRISRAIQDLLDYLPNIPAQLEILILQCLLTLIRMRSRLIKTYHDLQ